MLFLCRFGEWLGEQKELAMDRIMERINELSLPEKLISGGGILMLIASFFDWWHASFQGVSGGESAWGDPGAIWGILMVLVSIALAALVIGTRLGNMQMPALPQGLTNGLLFGGGAALVVILLLLKAWRILDVPVGGFGIGFYIGLVAAAALAYGGYLVYTEEKAGAGR
jgi:hypothetical protein